MDWYRIRHTVGMCMCSTAVKRAAYLKKHDILYHIGDNCMTMFRKIPLYPKLISFGDNVWIASEVSFVTHDVIHRMLNNCVAGDGFKEKIGCIDIKDNVFVGSNTIILSGVTIGCNTVIAAGSVVNKSIPGNGVYGGPGGKYICSLDDLIERRKNAPQIEIKRGKGGLSEETVAACWMQFNEVSKTKNKNRGL